MKKRFNHSPFVVGETVSFNGKRLKNPYVIKTTSGTMMEASPNGGGWCLLNNTIAEDDEVVTVKLAGPTDTILERMTGGWRIARDIDYFGKEYPMWCGKEFGFLYPDEVPEGYIAIPVRVYAYRDKKNPETPVTLFVAQAKLVKTSAVDNDSTLEIIRKYSELPGFWTDPNSSVMSHDEIYSSVIQLSWFLDQRRLHPVQFPELIALLESHGIGPVDYVAGFEYHLRSFKRDQAGYVHSLGENPKGFETMNPARSSSSSSDRYIRIVNQSRGPLTNEVDRENWRQLRDVLLLPNISDICRRADPQTDEKNVD